MNEESKHEKARHTNSKANSALSLACTALVVSIANSS